MLKRSFAFGVLLTAVACGSTNNTTTSPSPAPPVTAATTFTLSGPVTDSSTARPISGATVVIADGPNAGRGATTDGAGNYSFTGLQQSGFTVSVSAANYVSQSKGVTLTSNQALAFQLTRLTFAVSGTVTDGTSGLTVPNIVVQFVDGANAGKLATTDGVGSYNIGDVTPGTFTMSAAAVSYQTTTKQVTVSANTRVDFVLQRSCTVPPGSPGFLGWSTVSLPSGSVQLIWEPAAGEVASYVVEVGTTIGGSDVSVIDTGSRATSYTLSGLKVSVDFYHARVRAKNSCGVSGSSNEANPAIR